MKPFENVNVYPLIAKILGLQTPPIDGSVNVLSGDFERSCRRTLERADFDGLGGAGIAGRCGWLCISVDAVALRIGAWLST